MPFKHIVKQGECISSISFQYGFFPDTIWNLPDNSGLKNKRKDPNILMAGDTVVIPDKRQKKENLEYGKRNSFKRKGVPQKFVMTIKAGDDVISDETYILNIDEKIIIEGKTDDNGCITEWIPPDSKKGTLIFKETGEHFDLLFGYVDPIDEISGVQERLSNLGFYDGPIDGTDNDLFKTALKDFQIEYGLESSGKIDDSTKSKLKELLGS